MKSSLPGEGDGWIVGSVIGVSGFLYPGFTAFPFTAFVALAACSFSCFSTPLAAAVVSGKNASTEEQNTRIIHKLRSQETKEKQETKDSEVTQGNTNMEKGKCTGKLKLKRVKAIIEKEDEKDITQ